MVMKDFKFHTLFYLKLGAVVAGIPLGIIGAKKHSKVLITLSFLSFLGAYGLSEAAKKRGAQVEVATDIKTENLGKEIFTANCTVCHGADGKAGVGGASDLSVSTLSTEEAGKVIVGGRNSMPKFSYEGEQLKALTDYLESLKKK